MDKKLLTPGPVPCSPGILQTLSQNPIHHRTPEFEEIFSRVCENLKKVFQTEQPVLTLTSTGSGAMEAALVNTLSPGDRVIVIESGKFGQRWTQMAQAYGIEVIPYTVDWGKSACVKKLEKLIHENKDIKALFTQACETSTGVLHPIKDIGQLLKNNSPSTLFIVDGITAVGATPLPFDDWGIDVLIGGSQKSFMLPTGLSFIALSEKAWSASENSTCPKFYLDLQKERQAFAKRQTRFSAPVSLIKSLDQALKEILNPNLKSHLDLTERRAQVVRQGLQEMGFQIFSKTPSPSLTAVIPPGSMDSQDIRQQLEDHYAVTIMGGQDQLKGKILRIGHMGFIKSEDYRQLFEGLQKIIPEITEEQCEKAIQALQPLENE